jgi:hypothetical protein
MSLARAINQTIPAEAGTHPLNWAPAFAGVDGLVGRAPVVGEHRGLMVPTVAPVNPRCSLD